MPAAASTIDHFSQAVTADSAASALLRGVSKGQYAITNDILFEMARIFSNGVAPRNNTPLEAMILPLLVVVQTGFLWFYDVVVRRDANKKRQQTDG